MTAIKRRKVPSFIMGPLHRAKQQLPPKLYLDVKAWESKNAMFSGVAVLEYPKWDVLHWQTKMHIVVLARLDSRLWTITIY